MWPFRNREKEAALKIKELEAALRKEREEMEKRAEEERRAKEEEQEKKTFEEVITALLDKSDKKDSSVSCPDRHALANDCVCIKCPKLGTCDIEKNCRSSGCSMTVLTCSLRSQLAGEDQALSGFAEIMAAIWARKVTKGITPEEHKEIYKELKLREQEAALKEEETYGKKETGDTGTPSGDRPEISVSGSGGV